MGCSDMRIGFSTGSIALGNVRRGLRVATHRRTNAVELSALREEELEPLLEFLDGVRGELDHFEYISVHAPSRRSRFSERALVEKLASVAGRGWPIIVHPDVIEHFSLWEALGPAVCLENMDRRKSVGRTAVQLQRVFDKLPEATFCFDIGHARQVDPTMQEAASFLRSFGDRLRQVHMSYVNSQSRHERLNYESIMAFRRVARWLDESIPVILETPVEAGQVDAEISAAETVFALIQRHTQVECYAEESI